MRRMVCSAALFLFAVSHLASATNWVRSRDLDHGVGTVYVDADSVSHHGDQLIYWSKVVYSTPMTPGTAPRTGGVLVARLKHIKQELYRMEVNLGTRQARTLELFQYSPNKTEIDHDSAPSHWKQFEKDAGTEVDYALALKYAKEGNDNAAKPAL